MQEYRNGTKGIYYTCDDGEVCCPGSSACLQHPKINEKKCQYREDKPLGIAVELADCILRILDYCAAEGIDIDAILREKHEYNKTRPYRHGGKKC